jgi:hypothetical protein
LSCDLARLGVGGIPPLPNNGRHLPIVSKDPAGSDVFDSATATGPWLDLGSVYFSRDRVCLFRNNDASALGQLSVEGLHVVKDCLLFDGDLDFRRDPNSRPEIYIINTPNDGTFGIRSQNFHSPNGTFTQIESSRLISKPAIIWELSASKFGRAPKAVLVSRLHEKDSTTYCKFEMGLDG